MMFLIIFAAFAAFALWFGRFARDRILDKYITKSEERLTKQKIAYDDLVNNVKKSSLDKLYYYRSLRMREILAVKDDYSLGSHYLRMDKNFDLFVENLNSYWKCVISYVTGRY